MPKLPDLLKQPAPATPPKLTSRRIGIHTSTAGGVEHAAERAYRLGCNTFQMFTSSPRMWKPQSVTRQQCEKMQELRQRYGIRPAVVHTNYLVNLCSANPEFRQKSIITFRSEIERALDLGAEYLVLHPGSFNGLTREEGITAVVESIKKSLDGLPAAERDFKILIENTAGSEFSLGGSFEQVGELVTRLRPFAPVGACIDTCHTHVRGYDIVTRKSYDETMRQLDALVGLAHVHVWHCNDAKSKQGSKLDRHEQIGLGTIGLEPFRWLLNDPRTAHAAFIAETPIAEEGDDQKNIDVLKALVENSTQQ